MEKPEQPALPPQPPSERDDVKLATNRCPFCHEDVSVAAADWVSCRSCQARHHEACWQEGGRCSACGDALFMAVAQPPATREPGTRFLAEAIDSQGSKVRLEVTASSRDDAFERVKALGLFPIKAWKKAPAAGESEGSFVEWLDTRLPASTTGAALVCLLVFPVFLTLLATAVGVFLHEAFNVTTSIARAGPLTGPPLGMLLGALFLRAVVRRRARGEP